MKKIEDKGFENKRLFKFQAKKTKKPFKKKH